MIKAILVFALLAFACSSLEVENVDFVKTSTPAVTKFQSWAVSTAVFIGGTNWDATSSNWVNRPSRYEFNISVNPQPKFVVAANGIKQTDIGDAGVQSTYNQYRYYKYEVGSGFSVKASVPDVGYALESGNTLFNQRTKFYACAIYKSSTNAITNKGCGTFNLQEWNADKPNQNTSVTLASFGTLTLNINYVHANQQVNIPKYVTQVRVNKMRLWTYQMINYTEFMATAELSSFSKTGLVGGDVFLPAANGFYLSGYSNPAVTTTWGPVGGNSLDVVLSQKIGTAQTSYTWTPQATGTWGNLEQYCDKTVNLVSSAAQVEIEVRCSSANLIKLAMAAFAMIAGLFML